MWVLRPLRSETLRSFRQKWIKIQRAERRGGEERGGERREAEMGATIHFANVT